MVMDARILLVSGNTRGVSSNTLVLATARELAPAGVTAVLYEGLSDLPAFNPDDDTDPVHPAVAHLRKELGAADAVVVCAPEYAHSLPGSFKNLLDWTVGNADLRRKPVAWINIAAQGKGDGAQAQLDAVFGYLDADVVTEACLRMTVTRENFGPDGLVAGGEPRGRIAGVLDALALHLATVRG